MGTDERRQWEEKVLEGRQLREMRLATIQREMVGSNREDNDRALYAFRMEQQAIYAHQQDDMAWSQVYHALLDQVDAAMAHEAALVALASELVEMEHGARAEQIQVLHRLGIVVTLDEHLARARAFADEQHAKLAALAVTAPDPGVGEAAVPLAYSSAQGFIPADDPRSSVAPKDGWR